MLPTPIWGRNSRLYQQLAARVSASLRQKRYVTPFVNDRLTLSAHSSSWWNRCRFANAPAAQATRKLSPDRLAVTGPCGQALPTWALVHQLAHHEDHACGSQEEPVVNRTAEGNGGDEPRRR